MSEPRVTDPEIHGYGWNVTVSDGVHTHRVWVPMSADRGAQEMAIEKWREEVAKADRARQVQAACTGAGP